MGYILVNGAGLGFVTLDGNATIGGEGQSHFVVLHPQSENGDRLGLVGRRDDDLDRLSRAYAKGKRHDGHSLLRVGVGIEHCTQFKALT
jgi:hypothetical protein